MPSILGANTLSGGYDVDNSLRFNSGSSDSLTRSTTAGNRTTWTFSTWFKRSKLGVLQSILEHDDTNYFRVRITSGDVFEVFDSNGNNAWSWYPLLRDTSAWYHIVIRGDSTDGTNGNRVRLYINGSLASANAVASIDQNYTFSFNQGGTLQIGKRGSTDYLDGYLAETILIDGSALAPDQFGEFDEDSGIWKPIDVSGLTFGTRGFYLEYKQSGTSANSSGLGADTSGNDHHFTPNNLTSIDQSTDTCTNNFATLNPLDTLYNGGTFTEGNLKVVTADSIYGAVTSTVGISSGKWYAEFKATDAGRDFAMVGIKSTPATGNGDGVGANDGYAYYSYNGKKVHGGTESAYGNTYDDGNIIGVAVDLDNNKIYWSKNGTFQNSGDPTTGSTGTGSAYDLDAPPSGFYFFSVSHEDNADGGTWEANFGSPPYAISSGNADADGHGNFEYAVPSGYFALCSKNLAEYG
jgi:hypothetical protein